jgi:hypothetical protein
MGGAGFLITAKLLPRRKMASAPANGRQPETSLTVDTFFQRSFLIRDELHHSLLTLRPRLDGKPQEAL